MWLNEGFATYMEYVGSDYVNSSWRTPEQFVPSDMQFVMRVDSLISTKRLSEPIIYEEDLNDAFDSIAYTKGAAVVRMLESLLTPPAFRKGLESYLKQL